MVKKRINECQDKDFFKQKIIVHTNQHSPRPRVPNLRSSAKTRGDINGKQRSLNNYQSSSHQITSSDMQKDSTKKALSKTNQSQHMAKYFIKLIDKLIQGQINQTWTSESYRIIKQLVTSLKKQKLTKLDLIPFLGNIDNFSRQSFNKRQLLRKRLKRENTDTLKQACEKIQEQIRTYFEKYKNRWEYIAWEVHNFFQGSRWSENQYYFTFLKRVIDHAKYFEQNGHLAMRLSESSKKSTSSQQKGMNHSESSESEMKESAQVGLRQIDSAQVQPRQDIFDEYNLRSSLPDQNQELQYVRRREAQRELPQQPQNIGFTEELYLKQILDNNSNDLFYKFNDKNH